MLRTVWVSCISTKLYLILLTCSLLTLLMTHSSSVYTMTQMYTIYSDVQKEKHVNNGDTTIIRTRKQQHRTRYSEYKATASLKYVETNIMVYYKWNCAQYVGDSKFKMCRLVTLKQITARKGKPRESCFCFFCNNLFVSADVPIKQFCISD